MYGEQYGAGKRRAVAAAASLALHGFIAAVLIWGLSSSGDGPADARPDARMVIVDIEPPVPPSSPVPESRAAKAPAKPAAEEGVIGNAVSREAPEVAVPLAVALAAPVAGDGSDAVDGAGARGEGAGAGAGPGNGGGGNGGGLGSPARWITGALRDSDYPHEVEAAELAGTVAIGFRVRTDGRVDRCTVVRSSGHMVLDDLTCRLFSRRYRFRPAIDARGQAIDTTLETTFTWGTRRR